MSLILALSVTSLLLNVCFFEVLGDTNSSANDAFVKHGIVPKFIAMAPDSKCTVYYVSSNKYVELGNTLLSIDTIEEPIVKWNADSDVLYTLIMIDLDTPTPAARETASPLLHWLVNNIQGDDVRSGDVAAKYLSPIPFSVAPHRYTFVVLEQRGRVVNSWTTSARSMVRIRFPVQNYINEHDLSVMAGNFFFGTNVDLLI